MAWRVGDVTITKVTELLSSSLGRHILPDVTEANLRTIDWIRPFVDDDFRMVMSFHSLIVETSDLTIMVDTCIGNEKTRTYPKWNLLQSNYLTDLRRAGFEPSAFDAILCTHMHVDHVGWNTYRKTDRWVPTFENARYLYARNEWEHWRDETQEEFGPVIEDSVQPIFDHGLADLVDATHSICDEVQLFPTPGHTPGHVSVRISSKGEEAVITGDVFHHPCQIAHPEWCATADDDQEAARATRETFLANFSDQPVLCIGTHFSGPTAGRLIKDGDAYRLDC